MRGSNRDTDAENRCVDGAGWESRTHTVEPPHAKLPGELL